MEKREPSLVPEWLRSSNHLLSTSRSDSSSLSRNSKNLLNSRRKTDVGSVRSPFLDRSSSTNTWRGSSNGTTTECAFTSFDISRNQRDKDRRRVSFMDPWDHELLRPSQPMTIRKQGNHLAQGLKNGGGMNIYYRDSILPGTKSFRRNKLDKDFPLLRAEERHGVPDVVTTSSSASLSRTAQSLSVVREGWSSTLAEVPPVIEKSNNDSFANASCNMVEGLVHAPTRTVTLPQESVNAQKCEERAIKQLRQLIPVVPSAPKGGSVLYSNDKSKSKPVIRSGQTGLASLRNTKQNSSVLIGYLQSNLGSQIKPDTNKKLVVLKPARENGVSAGGSPPISPGMLKGAASVNIAAGKTVEKKLFWAHTQSRNAFYRALKQKTSTNVSTDPAKTSSSCIFFPVDSSKELAASDPSRDDEIMERVEKVSAVERHNGFESADRPDEKETEFLKSLGWEENNTEEDEGLTEEEIRAFIEQHKNSKPSLVQKLPIIQEDLTPYS